MTREEEIQKKLDEINADRSCDDMTDKEKLELATELVDEKDVIVTFVDEREGLDYVTQFEAVIYLLRDIELLGLYVALGALLSLGVVNVQNHEDIARYLKLSERTYSRKRKKLIKAKLIRVEKIKKRDIIKFNKVKRFQEFILPEKMEDQVKYFHKKAKTVELITPDILKKEQKALFEEIESKKIEDKANEIAKKKEKERRRKARAGGLKTFPNEDYQAVLDAYQKYKGIKLRGVELARPKKAIRDMFLSERKIKDIIKFMEWLHNNVDKEEYVWLKNWTMETVRNKIPEFVAGKLKIRTMSDDYELL